MESTERKTDLMFDYRLVVKGVWGRNRSEKFHTERLKSLDRGIPQPDEDELKRLATMSLSDLKFKKGYWRVICRPIEVERHDGYSMEKFVMFSDVVMVQGDK
jgi:hypothetical protein